MRTVGLVLAATLLVSGCGSNAASKAHTLTDVTYVNPLVGDPLWNAFGRCMSDEGKRLGIAVHVIGPPGDKLDMVATEGMVSQAITNHAQAIVTWSFGAPAVMDSLFARAHTEGVLTATLLSNDVTKNQDIQFGDNYYDDEDAYLTAIAAHAGHQYVAVLSQYDGYGTFGNLDELRKRAAKYPTVTIVDGRSDHGVFANDVDIFSQMLASHPEVTAIASYNGYPGTLAAARERTAGAKALAYMGYLPGDTQVVVSAIDAGLVGAIRVRDICGTGANVIDRLGDLKAGKKVDRSYGDGFRLVSGDEFKKLVAAGKA